MDLIFFNFLKLVLFVFLHIVVVQLLSCVWLFAISWAAAHQVSLSFTVSQSLLKLMSIESVMPCNHLILCLLLLFLAPTFPSIRDFSNVSALLIRWSKYWSFSFSISLSNGYSGWISFRIDWLNLDVQGQTTNMEGAQRPLQQETTGLKIYWAWPCPLEQDRFLHIWILFIYKIELILFGSLLFHMSITNIFLGY